MTDDDHVPPGIHRISLPTPYPVGRSNAYLIEGDPPVLVDCGVRSRRATERLEVTLGEHGVRLEDVGALLLSHPHYDHAGAAAEIARRIGMPVYAHSAGVDYEFRGREAFYGALSQYGGPAELVEQLRELNRMGERFGEELTEVPTLERLADGDRFDLGGTKLDVLHTPGHNAGHLCYHDRDAGALFCGDLLLAGITPNPLPHFNSQGPHGRLPGLELYLASLERVEELGPLTGLAGHGKPIRDTAAASRKARRQIRQRGEQVLELCVEHPGETVFQLATRLFGEDTPLGQALAFTELLAHADRLEAQGRIDVDHDTGKVVAARAEPFAPDDTR